MKTIPSLVFVRSHARKYMRMRLSILLSLFRAQQGYTKKEPPGVLFKLFSDSLNMKRLPSDLAIFTLVKLFELTRPPSDSLTLFRSRWTIVRKRN
jgi:hypothetical protein